MKRVRRHDVTRGERQNWQRRCRCPGCTWFLATAALAIGLGGCGGGSGGKSGAPYTGSPDSGSPYGGSPAVPDGGTGSNGLDGGGNGGQVLPPYLGRIVVSPPALLFTGAGQTAALRAQAFDATGAPLAATFTF